MSLGKISKIYARCILVKIYGETTKKVCLFTSLENHTKMYRMVHFVQRFGGAQPLQDIYSRITSFQ